MLVTFSFSGTVDGKFTARKYEIFAPNEDADWEELALEAIDYEFPDARRIIGLVKMKDLVGTVLWEQCVSIDATDVSDSDEE